MHVTQSANSEGGVCTEQEFQGFQPHAETKDIMEQLFGDYRTSVQAGRPDVGALLQEELVDAKGPVSVDGASSRYVCIPRPSETDHKSMRLLVAGPAGLAADVRKALRSGMAGPRVTLHVETYGIAVSATVRPPLIVITTEKNNSGSSEIHGYATVGRTGTNDGTWMCLMHPRRANTTKYLAPPRLIKTFHYSVTSCYKIASR